MQLILPRGPSQDSKITGMGTPKNQAAAFEKDKEVFRQADGTEVIVSLKPRPGRHLTKYALAADIAGGAQVAELKDDSGLKVNDFLLLSFGTNRQELVQIAGFGSVHFARPTVNPQQAGAAIVRVDPSERAGSQRISSTAGEEDDLDGYESHDSWSSNEQAHQKERHRRLQRE